MDSSTVFSRRSVVLGAVVAAAVSVAGLLPSGAAAATVASFSFSGLHASASFSSTQGCIETFAYVDAVDGKSKDNLTGHTSSSTTYVDFFAYNYCDGTYDEAFGPAALAPNAFTVKAGDLGLASLNATVDVFDYYSGQTRMLQVSLTWNANGGPTRSSYSSRYRLPDGTVYLSRSSGVSRPAVVSGTIFDGTLEYAAGASYSNGEIDSTRNGSLTITR
jgi:hypothetical protein